MRTTVKELIKQLQELPDQDGLIILSSDEECNQLFEIQTIISTDVAPESVYILLPEHNETFFSGVALVKAVIDVSTIQNLFFRLIDLKAFIRQNNIEISKVQTDGLNYDYMFIGARKDIEQLISKFFNDDYSVVKNLKFGMLEEI